MNNKKRMVYLMSIIFIILLISMVSASFSDFLKSITGKAEQEPQDISITVRGTNPVTVDIQESTINPPFDQLPNIINPIENSVKTITFNVRVSDSDGVGDINDLSVNYDVSRGATSKTGNCPWQQDLDANTAEYLCSFNMNYYDETGDWNIQVEAVDFGNQVPQTDTITFVYAELKSMIISPATVNWDPAGVVPGSVNQKANNDPVIVTNIGNYAGLVKIKAFALAGETNPAETILADSFTAGISTGVGDPECSATSLQEVTDIPIAGAGANPGPSGSNTRELYYCIPSFPMISSQTYSTLGGNKWLILY